MDAMPTTSPRRQWMRTGLLFVGHAVNDGYGGFLAPLLPLLIQRLDLSLALAGLLGTIRIVTSSVLQPTLGHAIDRVPRPSLIVIGPLLSVAAIPLLGIAPTYAVLVVLLLVSGIGTAIFHPAAAQLVTAGRPTRAGSMMALFSSGGTLGPALAPLALVALTGGIAVQRTPWLILPGVVMVAAFAIPLRRFIPKAAGPDRDSAAAVPLPPRLAILWTAIVLAAMAATSFSTFLAVLVTARGGSPWLAGAAISAFFIGGAVCEFLAGNLSDRLGRRRVMIGAMALATPCLFALLRAPVPQERP